MNTNFRILVTMTAVVFSIVAVALFVSGCGGEKKMAPVAVGEMEEYRDPGIGFHIAHPKGWVVNAEVGRARFYNAPDVGQKFLDPTGVGPIGVEISVDVVRTSDITGSMKQIKDDLAATGVALQQDQAVTVAGVPATKVPYVANYGGSNIINGHHVFVPGDSAMYDIGFAGFGEYYGAYGAIFDASLNSFKLPKPKVAGRDETLPSESMADYDAKLFTFKYPENFEFTNPPKGTFEMAIELRGYRQDCTIRFDVFGAKGLTVEKVFDQNKGKYKARGTGKATMGGEPALFVNYPSRPDVDSRAYFVVKNDKVLRVTMNWYKPATSSYLPVYEKVIGSLQFK
jgi:hypothetical protein